MIPSEIIAKALLDTHTNSENYDPATVWIEALNIVSNTINNQIVETVREDYFWDEFKVDTVIWQTEYKIVEGEIAWDWVADTEVNIKKVNKLFIKYVDTDTYYTQVEYVAPYTLDKDLDEYAATQSGSSPFYYIQDRSVFIYPAPEVEITEWLKMNAIYTPPTILLASPESWLAIQPDKHYIYALWIEEQIYKSQWKINEANNAKAIFNQELIKLMTYLKGRVNAAKTKTITWLDTFR